MNVLFYLIGLLLNIAIIFVIIWTHRAGTIEVDKTDPKIPYLRIQLSEDELHRLTKRKYVIVKVDSTSTFTREKQHL